MEKILFLKPNIDITFWNKLRDIKINELKLNNKDLDILGFIKPLDCKNEIIIDLNHESFENDINFISGLFNYKINGVLTIFNKIEDFNEENIKNKIKEYEDKDNYFNLIVFGNLKNFEFKYCFYQKFYKNEILNKKLEFKDNQSLEFQEFIKKKCIDNDINIYVQHVFLNGNFTYDSNNNLFYIYDGIKENWINSLLNNTLKIIMNNFKYITNKDGIPEFFDFILIKNKLQNNNKNNKFSDSIKYRFYTNNKLEIDYKITNNSINVKEFINPLDLSITQNNMHLSLMQWRLEPDLRPDNFTNLKILVLGCGTLGCQIIRNLIAWNIKDFVLIDNSKISYSTPNRQILYKFEDAKNNWYKAEAAAQEIKSINPNTNVKYHILSIPMPGHFEKLTDTLKKDYLILENEIKEADVIYNMLDSKEGRYLPSLMGRYYNKIVFSIGLGYDSFVIVRHNFEISKNNIYNRINPEKSNIKELEEVFGSSGCFFCSDSIGPKNSMKDRTLDQQCTVTRPGLSAISSASGSELLINIIQKMLGKSIGEVPEYIRGCASDFSSEKFISKKSEICMACGKDILNKWEANKLGFLEEIINDPNFISNFAFKDLEKFDDNEIIILEEEDDE